MKTEMKRDTTFSILNTIKIVCSKLRSMVLLSAIALLATTACNPDSKVTPSQNLKGKILPSLSMEKDGSLELYDLRDSLNPQKAAFSIEGNATNLSFKYIKSRPIGAKTIKANYGDLSINHNKEMYLADRNWPNWTSVSLVTENIVMNNNNVTQLYTSYQETEGVSKLYTYSNYFSDYVGKAQWGDAGTINGCFEVYENYNDTEYARNAFYLNLKTQEYLFQKNINSPSSNSPIYGYKLTDLVKKPNGNMDTDPIDWTKADFVFCISYNDAMQSMKYNAKNVNVLVFVDMDTKTYVILLRNAEDDTTNGADKGRQTLLTTSWQPLNNLFKGWNL